MAVDLFCLQIGAKDYKEDLIWLAHVARPLWGTEKKKPGIFRA